MKLNSLIFHPPKVKNEKLENLIYIPKKELIRKSFKIKKLKKGNSLLSLCSKSATKFHTSHKLQETLQTTSSYEEITHGHIPALFLKPPIHPPCHQKPSPSECSDPYSEKPTLSEPTPTPNTHKELLLLYYHSNGESLSTIHPLLKALSICLHITILAPEYPSYSVYHTSYKPKSKSKSKDRRHIIIQDIKYILQFIKEVLGISLNNVLVFGRSLGSWPALNLALNGRAIGGLVLFGAFTSLKDVARNVVGNAAVKIFKDGMRNLDLIGKVSCPLLILHGGRDRFVPLAMAQELWEKSKKNGRFVVLRGCGHNDFHFFKDILRNLYEFISNIPGDGNVEPIQLPDVYRKKPIIQK